MTTTDTRTPAKPRKPTPLETAVLLAFHAAVSGTFIVAQMTGDEDTYVLHQVAGYTALAAIAVRALAGLAAPMGSPLRLPRPSLAALGDWLARLVSGEDAARRMRSPLYAWMAAILLAMIGAAAASGAVADVVPAMEDLHEALGEFSLPIVIGHVALVLLLHALKAPPAWLRPSSHPPKPEVSPR